MFEIILTGPSKIQLEELESDKTYHKRFKAVSKAMELLAVNPRHPSLQTHEYHEFQTPFGGKVFEAYAENRTAGAYRVFWCYGPKSGQITILSITPHP